MVGDGINDAPALARADVGLALAGTADIAAEAGDIVLMGDPLRPLPLLVKLSRQTVKIIRQNILWFAFVVNAVGIVVTAWLWPLFATGDWERQSPLVAVLYHQLGSLAVLLNSMRLLWFERAATSPLAISVKGRMRAADLWLEKNFDLHDWSHWIVERRRRLGFLLASLLIVLYAVSGLTIVAPDELAVARRFGRPVADLSPGCHWLFPWPVDDVVRVSQRVRTVAVGYREASGPANTPVANAPGSPGVALTWTSGHRREIRRADESIMITGDGNLVDILATVRYQVVQPRVYLFEVNEPDEVIRAATESVLRGLVAGRPFHELLTIRRAEFQAEVLERLQAKCAAYGSHGLGIEIGGVSLLDLHPPQDVVEAYYKVAQAMEERDRRINLAQEQATGKLKQAEAEATRIVAQARAAKNDKVLRAKADAVRFLQRSGARRELTYHQELQLTLDGIEAVLQGTPPEQAKKETDERRARMLAVQGALTDFRIYWDSVARALSGRELILIDSDKIQGRRQLFLFDPEQLRVPAPMLLPSDRNPPARGPFVPPGQGKEP